MDKILNDEKFHQVVVDLAELEFMNSTGLGVMIGRKNKLQSKNITIYLMILNKFTEKIYEMTGLYKIMPNQHKLNIINF